MQTLTDDVKAFIVRRMARREPPWRVAAGVQANFHIEIDREQVVACWMNRDTLPTPTGPIQERAIPTGPIQERATPTGPIQERATPTGPIQESATPTGPIQEHANPTRHRQDEEPMAILTDEIKEFIVRGLARYETPSRVAAAVKANFGIEISRHQVHEYDPACSRPPALRWVELHAVTREKFLSDVAAIGIAQKVVRLRMLDQFARQAMENNYFIKAAAFMEQAAKECGGIYESRKPPKNPAP